jgi:DNA-binding transcriptional MerR regulator
MTTQEVSELTGIAQRTVIKYANILGVAYLGEGRRKTYNWKKADVDRLKKTYAGKTGRPKKAKTE